MTTDRQRERDKEIAEAKGEIKKCQEIIKFYRRVIKDLEEEGII